MSARRKAGRLRRLTRAERQQRQARDARRPVESQRATRIATNRATVTTAPKARRPLGKGWFNRNRSLLGA